MKKVTIPKAIREQCWISVFGKSFQHSCYIPWCKNVISVFDFHVGHDVPDSKGGTLDINNLKPNSSKECEILSQNTKFIKLKCRIDTRKELDYFRAGGILQYILNSIIDKAS